MEDSRAPNQDTCIPIDSAADLAKEDLGSVLNKLNSYQKWLKDSIYKMGMFLPLLSMVLLFFPFLFPNDTIVSLLLTDAFFFLIKNYTTFQDRIVEAFRVIEEDLVAQKSQLLNKAASLKELKDRLLVSKINQYTTQLVSSKIIGHVVEKTLEIGEQYYVLSLRDFLVESAIVSSSSLSFTPLRLS